MFHQCPTIGEQIQGQVFKSFAFGYVPYIIERTGGFDGVDVQIMKIIGEKFKFELTIQKSLSWDIKSNGIRKGTIGEVN